MVLLMTDRVDRAYGDLTTFPPLCSVLDSLCCPALRDAQVFAELAKLCLHCVRAINTTYLYRRHYDCIVPSYLKYCPAVLPHLFYDTGYHDCTGRSMVFVELYDRSILLL